MPAALTRLLLIVSFLALAPIVAPAQALDPTIDYRICGSPARDADGRIARSSSVLAAYQRIHACPSTGKHSGACDGWALDHVIPLACGGCDSVSNLQWLPLVIKSAPGTLAKDRWERRFNCATK